MEYINYFDPLDKVFFTLGTTILITIIIYKIAIKLGKPIVVGGIISGMILSSTHISYEYFDIKSCSTLGDIGLVLFIMLLGSEYDFHQFSKKKSSFIVALINIIIPFILGALFVPILIKMGFVTSYQTKHVIIFSLFVGLSMSMAAFPIISMFIGQTLLMKSKIGKFALFCASVDEIIFWIILSLMLIYFQQNAQLSFYRPGYTIIYLLFNFLVAPYLLQLILSKIQSQRAMLGFLLSGCFLSATVADLANLHPVVGAFLFGIMLPHDNPHIKAIRHQLNDFVIIALLPIYFVKTGMDANLHRSFFDVTVIYAGLILTAIALFGKYISSYITGKILGYSNHETILLGSLLNIRGVLEVALINVGFEVGFVSNKLYSVLIMMTIATTWVATSTTMWINKKKLDVDLN